MAGKPIYTPEQDAIIIADYNAGRSLSITAKTLGKSQSGIHGRIHRLREQGHDIPIRNVNKLTSAGYQRAAKKILELAKTGWSVKRISEEVRRPVGWVEKRLAIMLDAEREQENRAAEEARYRKQRRCLGGCGRVFWSSWPGERICPSCKDSDKFSGFYAVY